MPSQGRRVALVIGNGNYQYPDSLPKLDNPTHDAEDIAAALRGFGFEVIEKKDQSLEGMNDAIAEFSRKIGDSEAALFYFAGHGLQVKGQNYLIPVNARIETEARVQYVSVNVNQILDEMDSGKSRANIVILDACRNNPISGKFRSGATRGLAAPTSQPKGTIIVYATDPGNVAADGAGRNGLFTAGLLTAFKGGDLSLGGVLTRASEEVERGSAQKQSPYINGPATLQKNFHFRITVEPGRGEIEKTFWTSIEHSTDPADFESYLQKYPKGSYRALAENQLKRLKAEPLRTTASPATSTPGEDPETQLWNEVKASGTREYLDAYLKQYPKGKYVALAKVELKRLDDRDKAERARVAAEKKQAAEQERQEAQRAEQQAWELAKGDNSVAAYAGYLERYPKGLHAALAQAGQQKAKREATDHEKQESARLQREQAEARRVEDERQRQQAAAEVLRREQEARDAAAERDRQEAQRKAGTERSPSAGFISQGGLTWIQVKTIANWANANSYCVNTSINGQTGWRMPTKDELVSLYKSGALTGVQGWTLDGTWSSTPGGTGNHYYVRLGYGYVYWDNDASYYSVSCVR